MLPYRSIQQNMALLRKNMFLNTAKDFRRKISSYPEKEKFLAELPNIVSSFTSSDRWANLPGLRERVEKVITYNSAGGNKSRGIMTLKAYQGLEKPENITEASMKQAFILAWCVELLQTSLILPDDIIDKSSTRRGRPSWYTLPGIGLSAMNDCVLLQSVMFDILKTHFGGQPNYTNIIDTFNGTHLIINIGQYLDDENIKAPNFSRFNQQCYENMAIYKLKNYCYTFPICGGLLLANKSLDNVFKNCEDTLNQIAILAMIQNDFMDCYGDEVFYGKMGSDIQAGKCTWFAVKALERLSPSQREVFAANYASDEEDRVQRIKQFYKDLELPALYRETEKRMYNNIISSLQKLPKDNPVPSSVMIENFHVLYRLWDNRLNEVS